MTTIEKKFAALEKAFNDLKNEIVSSTTKPETAAGDDKSDDESALTPAQKLQKRLDVATEKLTKLNEKIAGGKSKIPDKDAEAKTKLEETITGLRSKISETSAKEAKKTKGKPVVETKAEEKPKAGKNIPRITPAMTTQLKTVFESSSVEWDDKHKKSFVDSMNSLTAEAYAGKSLDDHMSAFADSLTPAEAGGAAVRVMTVSELRKQNKNLTEVSPGIYQHKTTGERVTGPAEDTDEDFDDPTTVDGDEYIVGQTTKRVYTESSEEFVGYWGVGKFYEADL